MTLAMPDERPLAPIERISIDVTETVATGKWTGIERVVRRLCAELQALADAPTIRPVVSIGGRFHALDAAGARQLAHPAAAAHGRPGGGATRVVGTLLSYAPPLLLFAQAFQKARQFDPVLRQLVDPEPAGFDTGDLVLLLDSYWAGTSSIGAARRARGAGAAIVSTIYDLIPITHPGFMPRSLTSAFPRLIARALRISDAAIAISQYSADELRRWLGHRHPDLPIAAFRLGNDPGSSAPTGERPFGRRYTMVGTIEPRKRHDLVLDAFEQRWETGADCHLTIVGRIGWASPATVARLAALEAQGRIRVVHDADDAQLARILADTDAVIMASPIEGFGLPIVEALALDIPVVASDIAIFREVGGDAIVPFASGSSAALVAAMERLEADPEHYRSRARAFGWPSWNTAARDLLGILEDMLHRPLHARAAPSRLD